MSETASPGPRGDPASAVIAPSRPLLTVVVPVYNGGDEIVENVGIIQRSIAADLPGEDRLDGGPD